MQALRAGAVLLSLSSFVLGCGEGLLSDVTEEELLGAVGCSDDADCGSDGLCEVFVDVDSASGDLGGGVCVPAIEAAEAEVRTQAALSTPTLDPRVRRNGTVRVRWRFDGPQKRRGRSMEVQRAGEAGQFRTVGSVQNVKRRHAFRDRPGSGTFRYRVRAITDAETTPWSAVASVTIEEDAEPPPSPNPGPDTPPTRGEACPSSYFQQVHTIVDRERARQRLGPLPSREGPQRSAQAWSEHMAETRRMSHGVVTGHERYWGQNVAYGFSNPTSVMNAWMNSPGHRSNILSSWYRNLGVGCFIDDRGVAWWTQNFN